MVPFHVIVDLNWITSFYIHWVIPSHIADKNIQENSIRSIFGKPGTPDYVLLRPGGLTNGAKTTKIFAQGTTNINHLESGVGGGRISRADVAHFLLNETLVGPKYANKAINLVHELYKYNKII